MGDYEKALADIEAIRSSMAAGTVFRGLGPATLGLTAAIAVATAFLEVMLSPSPLWFFIGWIAAAVVCVLLIGSEMIVRSRRSHGGLADAMIHQAVQQFLPAGMAGAVFAAIVGRFAPENAWMIPGVWQVLVGLGVFAAVRSLPPAAVLAGAWYFAAGFVVLMMAAADRQVSPWSMGLPFAVGQAMLAVVVHRASGGDHGRI